jgi:dTDP-4-amino-4,6-dideoxyglucose
MKHDLGDLALFGGPRAFSATRYVSRPNTGDRERFLERMNRVLDNQWLTNMGPMMYEFEAKVAELAGVGHCVSTNNATSALQMLLSELPPGSEVILPAMTFVATAHAVRWVGLRPVFCDVDPSSGLIDPACVEAAITPETSAILGVHLWGQPCDVRQLEKLAANNGLKLFFDSAHAVGCTIGGTPLGGFGDAEVFSFHATKVVNSFEGGAIVTDDDELAKRMRCMRNFGFGDDGGVELVGLNAKMSEASAAMGLTSLEAFGESVARNRANYLDYRARLADVPGLTFIDYDERDTNNHHYLVVRVHEEVCGLHRDLLLSLLRAENVVAQPYFSPGIHQMPPYLGQTRHLPGTEVLCGQVLALPTGPTIGRGDIEGISDLVRFAVTRGHELTQRWQARDTAAV